MLKKVLFILKNDNQAEINQAAERLRQQNVEVQFGNEDTLEINQEMIVITDQANICEKNAKNGNYVIAFLTQENREENFSAASYAVEGWNEIEISYFFFVYDRYAGNSITILETKRCIVREIKVEDVDALYEIYREPSITKYMENLMDNNAAEKEYTRSYIKNIYGFYGYGMWIVEEKETRAIIGRAGLESRDTSGGVELGFVIAKPCQRQGYAYEVCTAILQYAREVLELSPIYAYVKEENVASTRLCTKLGFEYQKMKKLLEEDFCEYKVLNFE